MPEKFEIGDIVTRRQNRLYAFKVVGFHDAYTTSVRELKYGETFVFKFLESDLVCEPLTRKIIFEKCHLKQNFLRTD